MTDPHVLEIQRRQLEPMSLTNSARYHAQCRSDIATVLALLIAQAAQLKDLQQQLEADEGRWQLVELACHTTELPSDFARLVAVESLVTSRKPLSEADIQRTRELAQRFGWEKSDG